MIARPGYGFGFETAYQRHRKLAQRTLCGFRWKRKFGEDPSHLCTCKRIRKHANNEHDCECGGTKVVRKGDRSERDRKAR